MVFFAAYTKSLCKTHALGLQARSGQKHDFKVLKAIPRESEK
jgi:hypothetical protein